MHEALRDLKIEAILEDELYTNPPLMPVVVAKLIGSKRDITRVFRLTKDITSRSDLKHLRRIRDVEGGEIECIVCSLDVESQNANNARLAYDVERLSKEHESSLKQLEAKYAPENILKDFRIALVPSEAPRTEHQLKACQSLWPCKYAKSNYLIKCIEGAVFDQAERLVVKIVANKLLQHLNSDSCLKTSGAVIFRCAQIYGVGLSCSKTLQTNPTKHSAMLAIDSVAQNAGSSWWNCQGVEEDTLQRSIQEQLDVQSELKDHKVGPEFLPYLCTNYDVIVTEEPCMMCTMGLVQSRIRRLFYLHLGDDATTTSDHGNCRPVCYPDGAIEKFLVHRDKRLNHRFEAWRVRCIN